MRVYINKHDLVATSMLDHMTLIQKAICNSVDKLVYLNHTSFEMYRPIVGAYKLC